VTDLVIHPSYVELIKASSVKIIDSARLGLINTPDYLVSYRPGGMLIFYAVLKIRVTKILSLTDVNDDNLQDITNKLEIDLANTYSYVATASKLHSQVTGNTNDNIALSFFLEMLERKSAISPMYYLSYYLLSMVDIADFEMEYLRSFGEADDFDNPEKAVVLLKASVNCLGSLMSAQTAAGLGSQSYSRMSGAKMLDLQQESLLEMVAPYYGAIKAQDDLIKARRTKAKESRREKRPLFEEMHKLIVEDGMRVYKAAAEVASNHGITDTGQVDSLRTGYYRYKKNQDEQ
jgi:hypothetical protein